jgi:5'-3' exonuclease
MGLNGCLQFIRSKYPHLLVQEHISKYAYQRVIVDIASYIYKYACIYGIDSSNWMNAFVNLIVQFKINRVHPIIVFDGKPPVEKGQEIDDRKEKKKQSLDKIKSLEDAVLNYKNKSATTEEIELLRECLEKLEIKGQSYKRLLVDETTLTITQNELNGIQNYIDKLKNSVVYITPHHFQKMKDVLTYLGISHLQADGEAESYCCFLVKAGFGSAVVSYDTDCIAHGATNIIFNMDANTGVITHLNINELYEEWKLDEVSIRDFGILVGCDYNRKNKIGKIGPVNAIKLLQTYKCIENIPNITFDQDDIDKMRALFSPVHNTDITIPTITYNEAQCDVLIHEYKVNPVFISQLIEMQKPAKMIKMDTGEESDLIEEEE